MYTNHKHGRAGKVDWAFMWFFKDTLFHYCVLF